MPPIRDLLVRSPRRLFGIALLLLGPSLAQPAELSTAPLAPPPFERLLPLAAGGAELVQLRRRCEDCPPWRLVDFHPDGPDQAPRKEKVSVQAGITAIYAYPGTDDFANVKVEISAPGAFEQDRAIVAAALAHEFRRKRARVAAYLEAHPDIRARVERLRPAGRELIEFERQSRDGVELVAYTENVIGLTGPTISQLHFFVPGRGAIVSAYLMRQKRPRYADIGEFLRLRAAFVAAWMAFLGEGGASVAVGAGAGGHAGQQQDQGRGLETAGPARLE